MGRGDHPGELEQMVLLSVLALGDDAYGMTIRRHLEEEGGRDVTPPTVYSALDRLESKGWVSSRLGEPTAERGGRAKRYFRVEPEGVAVLREARARMNRLWQDAPLEPDPEAP